MNSAIKIHGFEPKCPICLECWNVITPTEDTPLVIVPLVIPWVLECGHMICEKCLMKHKVGTRKCHMCRQKFTIKSQRKQRCKKLAIQKRNDLKEKIIEEINIYNRNRHREDESEFN